MLFQIFRNFDLSCLFDGRIGRLQVGRIGDGPAPVLRQKRGVALAEGVGVLEDVGWRGDEVGFRLQGQALIVTLGTGFAVAGFTRDVPSGTLVQNGFRLGDGVRFSGSDFVTRRRLLRVILNGESDGRGRGR